MTEVCRRKEPRNAFVEETGKNGKQHVVRMLSNLLTHVKRKSTQRLTSVDYLLSGDAFGNRTIAIRYSVLWQNHALICVVLKLKAAVASLRSLLFREMNVFECTG